MRQKLLTLLTCLLLMACSDDAQDVYSPYRAFFRFQPVSSVPPLYSALNSLGEYCTVRQNSKQYIFNGPAGSLQVNKTGTDQYNPMQAIGGFIIGKANLSDLGTNTFPLLCYDLVCPNCYEDANMARNVDINENGKATCGKCHRTNDLNNLGIISEGEKGRKLFRYHIMYSGDIVVVQN